MTLYHVQDYLESKDFLFHVAPYKVGPNEVIAPHSHEFIELAYIAEGTGAHEYKGRLYPVSKGDVFIIEPEVEHAYRVEKDATLKVYNVLFQPSLLIKELEVMHQVTPFVNFFYLEPFLRESVQFQSHLSLTPSQCLEMNYLLDRLVKDYNEKTLGYQLLIKARLIELFIFLSRWYGHQQNKPMLDMHSDQEVIQSISQFIDVHFAQDLTLEQLSQMCGMSQSQFTTKFKRHTGKTFIQYRNERRLKIAKDLLIQTDFNIIEIAERVGFKDLSFFNKNFKQIVGVSPGKYRRDGQK